MYAELLNRSAQDMDEGGPVAAVLSEREAEPPGAAVALRFMAAVHRLALEGKAPELDAVYPTLGGSPSDLEGAWAAFRSVVNRNRDALTASMDRPCQTNEVGRSAALLGGFLDVARRTGLPLRLLEVGASAGLNLWWDRYRFEGPWGAWGDPGSAVRVPVAFEGPPPALDPTGVAVVERRGCDPNPLDPTAREDRLALLSSVWADQVDRFQRTAAAVDLAATRGLRVHRANAWPWIAERLSEPGARTATVVFHSVVMQYLGEEERFSFVEAIQDAGRRASDDSPLAWLRMEAPGWRRRERHEVWLARWPGGEDRLLGRTAPHGSSIEWLDP